MFKERGQYKEAAAVYFRISIEVSLKLHMHAGLLMYSLLVFSAFLSGAFFAFSCHA